MINNKTQPAFAGPSSRGLSKLEYTAIHLLSGLQRIPESEMEDQELVEYAVKIAQMLLDKCEEVAKK